MLNATIIANGNTDLATAGTFASKWRVVLSGTFGTATVNVSIVTLSGAVGATGLTAMTAPAAFEMDVSLGDSIRLVTTGAGGTSITVEANPISLQG